MMKNLLYRMQAIQFPVILLAIWALAACLVNPLGDFPLNDDFSYGRTVFNLTELNKILFDDWFAITLIGQVFWGGLFCKIAGFSFTALRFSTLVMAFLGMLSLYKIGLELGQRSSVCLLATLAFGFNPLFFSLSYTFMTDVPFACTLVVSVLFFIKYIKTERTGWLLLATFFAIWSTLIRQLGIMLPISFALAWLVSGRPSWKRSINAFFPVFAVTSALTLFQLWFDATMGLPDSYGRVSKLFTRLSHDNFLWACFERVGTMLMYMGLFLFPINLFILKKKATKKHFIVLAVLIIFTFCAGFSIWDRFPWGNIFYNMGLGPKLLKDGCFFINVSPVISLNGIRVVAVLGMIGGSLLITNLLQVVFDKKPSMSKTGAIRFFITANIVLYGGYLMLDIHFFDRYFIPFVPFGLILLLTLPFDHFVNQWWQRASMLLSLTLLLTFSISATHDYLSWNRTRWDALDYLTKEKGITPNFIDGGFEFNGWNRPIPERVFNTQKSWWWVDKEDFVVSFGDLNGFKKIKAFPYQTYLPPGVDSIYILEKMK